MGILNASYTLEDIKFEHYYYKSKVIWDFHLR